MNAGDPYSNYDLALQEDRIKDLTPGISSNSLSPHTQINAMPGKILIDGFFIGFQVCESNSSEAIRDIDSNSFGGSN